MRDVVGGVAVALIAVVLWDAFESMILPRRITRRLRPTRFFYRSTWWMWRTVVARTRATQRREARLSYYGPLSLLVLLGGWAAALVVAFGALQWSVSPPRAGGTVGAGFGLALYTSGATFFTMGPSDGTPTTAVARTLMVVESATGFLFLATVIAYLPVLYQSFSRREVSITMLDARAGSPPSAGELLARHGDDRQALSDLLRDWERWSAELLESHLSYPVLSYFRSQHDNQSWIAALTAILDASAVIIVTMPGHAARQAWLTFAIARHAVVDLAQVLRTRPRPLEVDRLSVAETDRLREHLRRASLVMDGDEHLGRLAELRTMYEPYVNALAKHLVTTLPPWTKEDDASDNWRGSAFEPRPIGGSGLTSNPR